MSALKLATFAVTIYSLGGCALDADPPLDLEESEQASERPGGTLVQAGSRLLLLEVTDDRHAIYQDQQIVYASKLEAHAPRVKIAEVPAGNTAFVYRVGKVAFVWTNPDRSAPGFGVSPLVIWSARGGAQFASAASPIGTFATAVSEDGRQVVFPTNGAADGSRGDLVLASVDLAERTTLLANIQMRFGAGPCPPQATFVGDDEQFPVATFCEGTSSTATVADWPHGERRVLVAQATPRLLSVDAERNRSLTLLAGTRTPVRIEHDRGTTSVIANVNATFGFLGVDGAAFYTSRTGPLAELFRVQRGAPKKVLDLQGFYSFTFGSRSLTEPPTSFDGAAIASFDAFDPNTGLTNVNLSDARGIRPVVRLETALTNALFGPAFTTTSSHALYASITDPVNFIGDLVAANGSDRQVLSSNVWAWDIAADGLVSFTENAVFDPSPFFTTAELRIADLAEPGSTRLISASANVSYFPSHDRTRVAYTTDAGVPGLYVARVE